jgi:uncharacterized membrane protein YhhN
MTPGLLMLVTVIGAAHIGARYAGPRWLTGILKPLPVLLLATTLAAAPAPADDRYRWLIVAGLLCSAVGDVWLLFDSRFRQGLASFLVAHLFYIAAFTRSGGGGPAAWLLLVPFAAGAAAFVGRLAPHLGRDRPAVGLYSSVLALMAWRAAVRALVVGVPGGTVALAGAVLFMLSDGTLAFARFARPFAAADAVVMVTYYAAQILIAASVLA